jgi:hypothetical protein
MGWSDNEELLVVAEDGTVHRYFGLHGDFAPFSLGNVCFYPRSFFSDYPVYLICVRVPRNTAFELAVSGLLALLHYCQTIN